MAIRPIVLLGDPVLRTPARAVDAFDEDLEALVADMFETMYRAEGVGLAAPQIGVSLRVLVVDARDSEAAAGGRVALVNPSVVEASPETSKEVEGCLSIPGIEDTVVRPASVTVEGLDPGGEPVRIEAAGLYGRALQHEIDHLDGVLFLDRLSPLKRKIQLAKWKKLRAEAESETSVG